jgi:hypothetical protein
MRLLRSIQNMGEKQEVNLKPILKANIHALLNCQCTGQSSGNYQNLCYFNEEKRIPFGTLPFKNC